MIGKLTGRIESEEPTGGLLLDVGGVGYELSCPIGTVGRSERVGPEGSLVTLYVHTNLRQDALELFGFCSLEERAAFRFLITVPNVGPRLALSVLHVLPSDDLTRVIESEDRARLSKVPGVGKKTAERLVLELRGKLSAKRATTSSRTPPGPTSGAAAGGQLVTALTGLGYRQPEAERAAQAVAESHPDGDLSSLLRQALKYLAP